jgi:DNA-binding transcriptional LysR family regulator
MGNIELRLFRYFVALCEERSFSRAAERLAISAPTLTHQIQKLERELGARLLDKATRKVKLTEAGSRFLESARDVIHRADEAELTARKAARGEVGKLEVGFLISIAYSGLVQRLISGFQADYPGIDITLHQQSTAKQMSLILSNELDVGFARLPKQYPTGLGGFVIDRASVILAIPKSHPLARKRGDVDPKTLASETFVSTSVTYDLAFKRHVEAIAGLGGFVPKVGKRADDLTTVLTYVSAGYGIAVISEDMENCHDPNIVFKRLAAPSVPEVVYSFLFRTGETAPACRAFIEAMRAQALKGDNAKRRS